MAKCKALTGSAVKELTLSLKVTHCDYVDELYMTKNQINVQCAIPVVETASSYVYSSGHNIAV